MTEDTLIEQVQDTDQADGQEPDADAPDADALMKEIKKLRRENAKWRTQLREIEDAEEKARQAEMSELEKLQAAVETERKARLEVEQRYRMQAIQQQITQAASKAGMFDPTDAFRHFDIDSLDIENGTIDDLDKHIEKLQASKPYLFKSQQTPPVVSATNPTVGRQQSTREELLNEIYGVKTSPVFKGGGVFWPSTE